MIGQQNLLSKIDKLIENEFPRFIIITGERGQGKKTVAKYIAKKLDYPLVITGIKIEDIRNTITMAYKQAEPIIYLIPDADKMSIGAKNSLLKVIEEPPNNAYFIITLQTINNTLETIKSRCQELRMNNYSLEELNKFVDLINYNVSDKERNILTYICDNYYEIELLNSYGIIEFYDYVIKVINNIYKVQSANSFKLAEKLALKNEEDKYDLALFLKAFECVCLDRAFKLTPNDEEFAHYLNNVAITGDTLKDLKITGINKQSLIDTWILNIRSEWRK